MQLKSSFPEWGSSWAQCPGSSLAAFQRGCPPCLHTGRGADPAPPRRPPRAHVDAPGLASPRAPRPHGPPQHGVSAPALPQPLPLNLSLFLLLGSSLPLPPHGPSTTRSALMGTCRQHQCGDTGPRALVFTPLEARMAAVNAPRLKAAFSGLCQRPSS